MPIPSRNKTFSRSVSFNSVFRASAELGTRPPSISYLALTLRAHFTRVICHVHSRSTLFSLARGVESVSRRMGRKNVAGWSLLRIERRSIPATRGSTLLSQNPLETPQPYYSIQLITLKRSVSKRNVFVCVAFQPASATPGTISSPKY